MPHQRHSQHPHEHNGNAPVCTTSTPPRTNKRLSPPHGNGSQNQPLQPHKQTLSSCKKPFSRKGKEVWNWNTQGNFYNTLPHHQLNRRHHPCPATPTRTPPPTPQPTPPRTQWQCPRVHHTNTAPTPIRRHQQTTPWEWVLKPTTTLSQRKI